MRSIFVAVLFVCACSSKETASTDKGGTPPARGSAAASGSALPGPGLAGSAKVKRGPNGQAPPWVPLYPNATPADGFMKAGNGWAFSQETSDAPDLIFAHFERVLAEQGFTVQVIKTPNTPKVPGMINATTAEPPRKLALTVSQTGSSGTTKVLYMTDGE